MGVGDSALADQREPLRVPEALQSEINVEGGPVQVIVGGAIDTLEVPSPSSFEPRELTKPQDELFPIDPVDHRVVTNRDEFNSRSAFATLL